MTLKLKDTFQNSGSYIGLASDANHDSSSVDNAWVVMFDDENDRVECVICFKRDSPHGNVSMEIEEGQCWETVAHGLFVALGWESPWEEV